MPVAVRFLQDPSDAVRRVMALGDSVARFVRPPSSQLSPIMTGRSINYHYGAFQLPFAQIRNSAKAVGHSVNDAYLASVAEAMGEYHRRQGAPVDQLNLNMPISLRSSDDFGQNAVTIAHFTIDTSELDPLALMQSVSATVAAWRAEPALSLADQLAEISRFIPFEVISAAATASDVTASNVPGPPVQVFLAGAKVEQLVPLPPPIGAAVFVALLTYNGQATIGVAMDDKAVSDRELLMECMRHGFAKVTGARWGLGPLAAPRPAPAAAQPDVAAAPPAKATPAPKKPTAKKAAATKKSTAAPKKATAAKKSPEKPADEKKPTAKKRAPKTTS